jgi:hypothetical protein
MAANPWDGAKAAFPKAGRRGRNELAIAVGSICRWQLLVVFGEARAERGGARRHCSTKECSFFS